MIDIKLKNIVNDQEKIDIFNKCDCAFEESISSTDRGKTAIKKICKNGVVFAAFHGNEICGYIAMYANDLVTSTGFISILAVLPEFQRENVGHKLLIQALEYAKSMQMNKIQLEVQNTNLNAIKFYQKHGFIWCNKYCSNESRLMEKNL